MRISAFTSQPLFIRLIFALFAVVLLATACGSDSDAATSGSSLEAPDTANNVNRSRDDADASGANVVTGELADGNDDALGENGDRAPQDSDGDPEFGSGSAQTNVTAAQLGRQIIFTAQVSVDVDDVAEAGKEATAIIDDVGGFVFGQDTVGGNSPRSEITFKVFPERFNEALARLGEIGELRNQSISTDDVTERVVDLESRIEVAQLGVERLRAALENAANLEDFARVEELLLARESTLEVMRGQLRTLQDRVDLATITLILTEDVVSNSIGLDITSYEGFDAGLSCPGESDIQVEADTDVTVCFEVTNTGEQTLTNITITDSVLEITSDTELIAVFDDLDELAPGQSALVAIEIAPERTIRPRPRVSAIPTDGVSDDAVGPAVSTTKNFEIRTFVVEPDDDPGFDDGFGAATALLLSVWVVLTVLAGFLLLPLLILVPIGWFLMRFVRPRLQVRSAEHAARIRARMEATRAAGGQQPPPPREPAEID